MSDSIFDNLKEILGKIADAAKKAGRNPDEVELIAVSKGQSPEAMAEVIDAGHFTFGENRVQEAKIKIPMLSNKARWHLIGHLQSNKVRQALPLFDRIQSVDSLDLAHQINRIAGELGLFPKILLEINVAGEASKFGFKYETLRAEMEKLLSLDRLALDGVMAIPPFAPDPETSRPYFARLREWRDALSQEFRVPLPILSMGMSNDYTVAIEEGATMVRVGTALFGERKVKTWKPPVSEGAED